MTVLDEQIILQVAVFLLAIACVQDLNYQPNSSENTFAQLLQQATCASVKMHLPASASDPVCIDTLGDFENIALLCEGNSLQVMQTLRVEKGMTVTFTRCVFEAELEEEMVRVEGRVLLLDCEVRDLKGKAFEVNGELVVERSTFQGNRNSLFSLSTFGVFLHISRSTFSHNSCPQGVILLLQPSGTLLNSTTGIAFEYCDFQDNAASTVGSILYVAVAPAHYFTLTQLQERKELTISNSHFVNSPGYLWYLQIRYLNVSFHNNTIKQAENPIFLALFDNFFVLRNTSIQSSSRPLYCNYVGGLVLIDGLEIEDASNGPALMVLNQATFGMGQVIMKNIDFSRVNMTNFTFFVSTFYVIAASVTITNVLVHSGFSFAAACGGYFFSVVVIDYCTITNITLVQQGIVGHLFGTGINQHLSLFDCNITSGGAIMTLGASLHFQYITYSESNTISQRALGGLYSFFDGDVNFTDVHTTVRGSDNPFLVSLYNGKYVIARHYWNAIKSSTFLTATLAQVLVEEVVASKVDIGYFVAVATSTHLQLYNLNWVNPRIFGGLVSAAGLCSVEVWNVRIVGGNVQSLVASFHSTVQMSAIEISRIQGDALVYSYLFSVVSLVNLRVLNSTVSLITSEHGRVIISDARFADVVVSSRFLKLRAATVELQRVTIENLFAWSISPLCAGSKAQLTFKDSTLAFVMSREQGLIVMTDSNISFLNTTIHNYNATFLSLTRTSFVLEGCNVFRGGLELMDPTTKAKVTAGFMEGTDSSGLVLRSYLRGISGINGGCFALTSTDASTPPLQVENSTFEDCLASINGGVIYANSMPVLIFESVFQRNRATNGGSLYFACEDTRQCDSTLAHTIFAHCSALNGGVVKWTKVRPNMVNITSFGNKAEYGDFEASLPTHTVLLNSPNQFMEGIAGVVIQQPILIAFLDALNQTVRTDNQSTTDLLSDQLVGTTHVVAVNGVANFSSVIVQTRPASIISIVVFSPSINQTFPKTPGALSVFDYFARACFPGEITTETGCYPCPSQSFSVEPTDRECNACPTFALCSGGMHLDLDEGYWRSSELSSEVYLCPIQSACLGGQNSTCAEGFSDKVCAQCAEGFYLVGMSACVECESQGVRAARSVVFISALIILGVLFVRKGPESTRDMKAISVLTILKILLNHLHSVMIISVITVDWRWIMVGLHASVEMFLSLALNTFSVECYWSKVHTDGSLKPVYLKVMLALGVPIGILLLNAGLFLLLHRFNVLRRAHHGLFQVSLLLLTVITPYVMKTSVQLIACRQIDGDSYWMSADVSIQCWTTSHYKYVLALFLPAFIIYGLGVPSIFACLFAKFKLRNSLIFLTSGYSEGNHNWEIIILIRKLLLILVINLLGSIWVAQNLATMVLLYVSLDCHLRLAPYKESLHNKLEAWSLVSQLVLAGASFYLNADIRLNVYIQQGICVGVFAMLVLYSVLNLLTLVFRLLPKRSAFSVIQTIEEEAVSEVSAPLPSFASPAPSATHRQDSTSRRQEEL